MCHTRSMVWLLFITSYLWGSIPYGKLFCLLGGTDIQKRGSGNIGFANVQRTMGWKYSVPTLVCDILKGAVAAYVGLHFGESIIVGFTAGYCALLGHVSSPWLKFRGGKGIATGLGVAGVLSLPSACLAGLVFFSLRAFRVRASHASLAGCAIVVCGLIVTYPTYWWMGALLGLTAVVTLRHNIKGTVPNYG